MKKILLLFVSALIISCGSIRNVEFGHGFLLEDRVTNSLDKSGNYILANEWMVEAFNNAESVIQFSDKEAGIVKGKYILHSGESTIGIYGSTSKKSAIITIRVKDSSAKIEVDTRGLKFEKWVGTGIYAGGPIDGRGYTNVDATRDKKLLIESFKQRLAQ